MTASPQTKTPLMEPAAPQALKTPTRAWLVTGMLFLMMVINWGDKAILGLTAHQLIPEFGLSKTEFGFIGSAFYFLYSVTCLGVGYMANRISNRTILIVLAILWSITQMPILMSATAGALLFSRVALGAAEGPFNPVANNMVHSWFPNEKRGLPQGILSSGASVAKIAIAPILAVIIATHGWRWGFVVLIVIGIIWIAGWLAVGRDGPYGNTSRPANSAVDKRTSERAEQAAAERKVPMRKVLLSRTFIGAVLGMYPHTALLAIILTFLPTYFISAFGMSETTAGSLMGLPSISSLVVLIGAGWLTDRLIMRKVRTRVARGFIGAGSLIVGGAILACLPLANSPTAAIVILVTGYGIAAAIYPIGPPARRRDHPAGPARRRPRDPRRPNLDSGNDRAMADRRYRRCGAQRD